MVWCAVLDAAAGWCQVGTEAQNRFGTVSTQSAALEPGMELELLLLLRAEKLLFADTRESRLELIIFADLSHHNSSASSQCGAGAGLWTTMSGEAKSKKRFAKGKGKKEEHAENGDNGISVSAGNILTQ